jgi:hypothetical protein
MWTVWHYWMVIYDPELRKSEWAQFVVSPTDCRVLVRKHFGDTATPGSILSTHRTTLEEGRKLWHHYITKQAGEHFPHMDEVRSGDDLGSFEINSTKENTND